jgi:hypothetical protein
MTAKMRKLYIIKIGTTFASTKSYMEEQKKELVETGLDVSRLLDSVSETPVAAEILWNFGGYAVERTSGAGKADARQPETLLSQTERK